MPRPLSQKRWLHVPVGNGRRSFTSWGSLPFFRNKCVQFIQMLISGSKPHYRVVNPRPSPADQALVNEDQLNIIWSRDGDFDKRPGVWFQPNHFVPVIREEEVANCPVKQELKSGTARKTKQKGTFFSY